MAKVERYVFDVLRQHYNRLPKSVRNSKLIKDICVSLGKVCKD